MTYFKFINFTTPIILGIISTIILSEKQIILLEWSELVFPPFSLAICETSTDQMFQDSIIFLGFQVMPIIVDYRSTL